MVNRSTLLLHIDVRAMGRAASCIRSSSYQEGWKLSSLDRSRGLFQNFGPIALCKEFWAWILRTDVA
jgi:hypothetical protein